MEMPKPQDEHKRLSALAGAWTGEEKLFPSPWDPKGGPATSMVDARIALEGFYLLMDYTEKRGNETSYRGHGVFGYDTKEQVYTMNWFDSMGFPAGAPARGRFDGNRLSFTSQGPMGHGRYVYDFQADGSYRFSIENSQDGKQWSKMMEGTYRREENQDRTGRR
jgi:hypothetical protein